VSDYDRIADLPLEIADYSLERRELVLPNFTRVTTTIVLRGGGEEGRGEDVTYEADMHDGYPEGLQFAGTRSIGDSSSELEQLEEVAVGYRRWGFESAALDLALRQAGRSLGDVVGREYRTVRFVASTRAEIDGWLEVAPELEFKLDASADWTRELIERLAGTDRVRVGEFIAFYEGHWLG
jgi:L-alanine-DL-glutamate epimerase-like enolase superfamily enzyme